MKILLYFEGQNVIGKSGIGRALSHQKEMLSSKALIIHWTLKRLIMIFYILAVWTESLRLVKAKRLGKNCFHAHSTEEDFEIHFVGSNQLAPLFKNGLSLYTNKQII